MPPIPTVTLWIALLACPCSAQQAKKARLSQIDALIDALINAEKIDFAGKRLLTLRHEAVPSLLRRLAEERSMTPGAGRIIEVLGRLGPAAVRAIPDLLDLLGKVDREHFALILEAVDAIAPYAEDHEKIKSGVEDAYSRHETIKAEWRYGAFLLPKVRRSLSRLRLSSNSSTQELIEYLEQGDFHQRELAAQLLSESRKEVARTLEALNKCLDLELAWKKEENAGEVTKQREATRAGRDRVLLSVAGAISILTPSKDVPTNVWLLLLNHSEQRTVVRAIHAVAAAGTTRAVAGLTRLLNHSDKSIAKEAIIALGAIGHEASSAIRILEALSRGKDKALASIAANTLKSIQRSRKH